MESRYLYTPYCKKIFISTDEDNFSIAFQEAAAEELKIDVSYPTSFWKKMSVPFCICLGSHSHKYMCERKHWYLRFVSRSVRPGVSDASIATR